MYTLTDSFNRRYISTHRTLVAAILAEGLHSRAVRRHNGAHSYVTYSIRRSDGAPITLSAMVAAEEEAARVANK
jgi:hypothetical protein